MGRHLRTTATLAALVLVVLAGCSSDDSPEAAPSTTTARVSTTSTTTEAATTASMTSTTSTTEATTTTSTTEPSTTSTTSTTTTTAPAAPEDLADAYALEKSGGEREGCSSAAPGAEAEANGGCIYTVAYGGCYEGLTGDQLSPLPVEEEFPTEPGLVAIYRQAVADCMA